MFCYNCGAELSEHDFCTACGADVAVYKKILMLSNRYYNEGLRKAQVRDLTGAIASLRQSLKCYKYNTDARNLLGLCYFEMGEGVDAISEWVISKNLQPSKNIADDYLATMQSNPGEWDDIRQTLRKYNQALNYCFQDSLDLAVIQLKKVLSISPNFVRGELLLALLHMNAGDWDRARKCVYRALAVDAGNTTALQYAREIELALDMQEEQRTGKPKKKKKKKGESFSYKSGNEMIIQPLNAPEGLKGGAAIINLVIGLVVGLAIMWFLVLPARIAAEKADANKDVLEVSNQLTERSASMDEIQKRVDALEAENTELLSQVNSLTGSDGLLDAADILMKAAKDYLSEPEDMTAISEELESIDSSYLAGDASSDAFQELYKVLSEDVGAKASGSYLANGLEDLKDSNYADAITNLTKAYELDPTCVEALYNLGHAYRRSGDDEKAKDAYSAVVSKFPDTEYATNAQEYLSGGDAPADVTTSTGNGESRESTTEPAEGETQEEPQG